MISQLNPSNRPSTSANKPIFREEVDNPEVASAIDNAVDRWLENGQEVEESTVGWES
ncbi:uncharacterized protein BDV14DRAFT_185709 [Aspergillus stella-maris]|uniref:uncharacterized protein n=1 Tax=Aspergillus stella-maris TaxID=1810926 RepID=UPI003CCE4E7D